MTTTTHIDPTLLARVLNRADLYKLPANGLQCLCLLAANSAGSLTMGTMARTLGVSATAVTGMADSLEKLGLIIRQPSRNDRRVIWLILTDRGKKALADILNA